MEQFVSISQIYVLANKIVGSGVSRTFPVNVGPGSYPRSYCPVHLSVMFVAGTTEGEGLVGLQAHHSFAWV